MRDDGYFYVEDGDLPDNGEIVWCDTSSESGQGFLKDGKWYSMRKAPFSGVPLEFKSKVICWKRLNLKKRIENENSKA